MAWGKKDINRSCKDMYYRTLEEIILESSMGIGNRDMMGDLRKWANGVDDEISNLQKRLCASWEDNTLTIACPKCGNVIELDYNVVGTGDYPDTPECKPCGWVHSGKRDDLMLSLRRDNGVQSGI